MQLTFLSPSPFFKSPDWSIMWQCNPPPGGTPVLLPYLAYTGMCHWTGYGFLPLCSKQGIYFCAMARLIVCTASV